MLQLSKILKSRNEWRDKAKKRTKEIWEMRKVHKYYQERVANLIEENKVLKEKIEQLSQNKQDKKKRLITR
jgi:hypothetical protein